MTGKPIRQSKLFQPIKVGSFELKHRVAHSPTTRLRADENNVPSDLQLKYYTDRTTKPGTLVVSEAAQITDNEYRYPNVPGIWNNDQVKAWKIITDAVHKNKSAIALQLWSLGRIADPEGMKERGFKPFAPSAIYESEEVKAKAEKVGNTIHEMTEDEIHHLVNHTYVNAAKNGLAAGFDFIEIHSANGYLLEQFINPCSNKRTDKYGGSIENRTRLTLEVIDALIPIVGADKLAVRFSPWSTFQGMLAENDEVHPIATFGYLASELQKRADNGNELAYISLVDGRFEPDGERGVDNTFFKQIWKGKLLRGGNYTYDAENWETVLSDMDDDRSIAGFGRLFISNPDLPDRIENEKELNPYDRSTFMVASTNKGYNTYSKLGETIDVETESKMNAIALV